MLTNYGSGLSYWVI